MKALNYGVAFLLAIAIAICFAYKHKLDEANRYIEHMKQDCAANHSVRIGK